MIDIPGANNKLLIHEPKVRISIKKRKENMIEYLQVYATIFFY